MMKCIPGLLLSVLLFGALWGCVAPRPLTPEEQARIHAGAREKAIEAAASRNFPALVFVKPIRQDLASGERKCTQTFGSGIIINW